jgi:hypothetical protein
MRLGATQSQWKNVGFPQFSWVFMPICPENTDIYWFLGTFVP